MSRSHAANSVQPDWTTPTSTEGIEEAAIFTSFGSDGRSLRESVVSKLDVLRAKQINRLTFFLVVLVSVLLLYSLGAVIESRTYGKDVISVQVNGKPHTLPSFNRSNFYRCIDMSAYLLQIPIYYTFAPVYLLRVFRNNRRSPTFDQKTMAFVLVVNVLSVNPLMVAHWLNMYVFNAGVESKSFNRLWWFRRVYKFTNIVWAASGAPTVFLYLWVRVHEFALLRPLSKGKFFRQVFLPKLLVCLLYWILRSVGYYIWTVETGVAPFSSLILLLKNIRLTSILHMPSIITVGGAAVFEIVITIGIVTAAFRTSKILRVADYFLHRSRIVGFKFFCFHNLLYLGLMTLADNVLALAVPSGVLAEWIYRPVPHYVYMTMRYSGVLTCMKIFWIVIAAYVTLPPDSVGFRGWFKPCSVGDAENTRKLDDTTPVSFSLTYEPVTNSSIFGFRDVTLMLNFSWLAYSSTKEELNFYTSDIGTPDMFEVFVEEKYDTKVIIADLADRIVVAFRGTKSTQNMKTDLKVNLVPLSEYLPTVCTSSENGLQCSSIKGWSQARIHHGFGVSYRAVGQIVLSKLRKLLEENSRPVFLTGHSLGGALATVCSLDILLSDLPLRNDQITVVTFGSPKCGNKICSKLYNRMVPSHWRVHIVSDVVAMMPNIRYAHVGKIALLTTGGHLILDPSALDSSFSYEVPSINFHKKPAYKLAFCVVCEKHLQGLDSGVWSFPISESDLKQWEKQCMFTFSEKQVTKLLTKKFDKKSHITTSNNGDEA